MRAAQTDDRIESSAKQSYVFKTYLKDDVIKVKSKDGVVTLTGTVAEESHEIIGPRDGGEPAGVKSVDNMLEFKGEPAAANSDAWVVTKVKASLLFHRNLSGGKTEVQAKDGVVTLRGKPPVRRKWTWRPNTSRMSTASKIVKNEMTVAKCRNRRSNVKWAKT